MKYFLRTTVLSAFVLLASCSGDDDNSNTNNTAMDAEAEALEQTPLNADTVSDNVSITNAQLNTGTPPTPNGGISLSLPNNSNTAFLGEGFKINLNSDGQVTGAYLVFKANDGTAASNYYDVTLGAFPLFKRTN
ncbi:MAG: hypothetical protein AAGF77_09050 [Bacteroidota bacterium]